MKLSNEDRWRLFIEFARKNQMEKRPFQKLLAQNRYEMQLILDTHRHKANRIVARAFLHRPLLALLTLIETPKIVRLWAMLLVVAMYMRRGKLRLLQQAVGIG